MIKRDGGYYFETNSASQDPDKYNDNFKKIDHMVEQKTTADIDRTKSDFREVWQKLSQYVLELFNHPLSLLFPANHQNRNRNSSPKCSWI